MFYGLRGSCVSVLGVDVEVIVGQGGSVFGFFLAFELYNFLASRNHYKISPVWMERINTSPARSFGSGWVQPTLLVVWRFGRVGRRTRERRSPGIGWDCWRLRCWVVRSKTPWNGSLAFSVVEKEKRSICVCRPARVRACGPGGGMLQAKAAAPLRSSPSLQGLGPNALPGPGVVEEGSYCL